MPSQSFDRANREPLVPEFDGGGFLGHLKMARQALAGSPVRRTLTWLSLSIVVIIIGTSIGQILLNRWNKPFYDALERRDFPAFMDQLLVFAAIAAGLLVLNVAQQWLNQMIRLKLREGLTLDLIGEWLRPGRAFRLANAGAVGVNPDQRMQQDAGHLADLTTDLGIGLLQASILLASFVGVLWSLSSGFVFHVGGSSFAIPGYMVWAAFIYAGSASWLSWLVGRPLITENSERYSREAELRFSMVRINQNIDAIALARGEADEVRRLETDLGSVLNAMRRIFATQINLAWVTDGYGWFTVVAPILVAAPVYFAGDISFGGLMMAVGAFNQVHASLRWFINNVGAIADWRATLMRVGVIRSVLVAADVLHDKEDRIGFTESSDGSLAFDQLEIASPSGCTKLSEPHVRVKPGERVLIVGEAGAGKTLLFRALAGLWPWGRGRIELPAGNQITFLPRQSYLPPGSLRDVLAYPTADRTFEDAEFVASLGAVGLDRLVPSLDRTAPWAEELNSDELRLLAFARLRLHRPDWVIVDEAFDTLDVAAHERVSAMFEGELAGTGIIYFSPTRHNGGLFDRTVHLARDKRGPALRRIHIKEMAQASATI
ncbi:MULTISPECIES: ABC transporter ATP-binding protein/permease [Hyphomicrobiales]|uniref:ABC transporter ATP-binding protein/permease n=1 Tax=Hyphomicrobiales TaxID=356 RepID=UPI00037F2104|nr:MULTISPECIES: ABC transporter ATP-binding protein/permease [Phyllobacteriaceae]MCX8567776.1 ABC transporter ATP-binding protein/permease [Aminobacter sp. MET-1]